MARHRVPVRHRQTSRTRPLITATLWATTILGTGIAGADRAAAQSQQDDVTGEETGQTLAPIVLHGDRTASTLDETRASVSVVRGEPVDAPAVQTVKDAYRRAANVSAGDWTESGFIIRGINSEGLVPGGAGAPLASFYIDGVQQTTDGTRRGARGMFDAEQVEIYRGPQSTLSGRAALAGAIYMRTIDPDFIRSGAAQLTYGSDNHRQAGLAFGDALGSNLAYRFSAEWSKKDSDINYPSYRRFERYDDFATDEYYTLRGKVLWLPMGDQATRVLFSYSHSYDSPEYNDIVGSAWSGAAPSYSARRGDAWGALTPEPYASMVGELPAFQETRSTKVDNFGIEVTHDFSDVLRFTSMTGFSRSVTDRPSINAGTPGEFLFTEGQFTQRTISQEFRLNYEVDGFRWVAGVYGAWLDNDAWRNSTLLSYDESRNSTDISNLALFGETTYEFAPGWNVIAGARLDWISQKQDAFYAVNGMVTSDTASDFDDTVLLPKFGIEYAFTNGQTVSLIYQEGYRQGGAGIRSSDGVVYSYDPEYAKTLELAWRARFLDDRLSVGANVFYQDWKHQQIEVMADPTDFASSYIANAGKSESYGGELELAYAATDELNLFASVGLLHTEFKEFNIESWGADFSGQAFPNAPEQMVALGFRWAQEQGWFAAAAAKYTSSSTSRLEQGVTRPVELKPYTIVDAEFGYAWEEVKLTAYATNLFDKEYFTYEYGPGALATLGERREVGMRLDYRF